MTCLGSRQEGNEVLQSRSADPVFSRRVEVFIRDACLLCVVQCMSPQPLEKERGPTDRAQDLELRHPGCVPDTNLLCDFDLVVPIHAARTSQLELVLLQTNRKGAWSQLGPISIDAMQILPSFSVLVDTVDSTASLGGF